MGWKESPISFIKTIKDDLAHLQSDVVGKVLDKIVDGSPVDTSAFVSNNIVSLDAPDYSWDDSKRDLYGVKTKRQGKAILERLKTGNHRFIYIQNNAPYGEFLEHGSSKQAPLGIYGLALISTQAAFK